MARPLRVEYSGACYHVINRGNNQEDILLNDQDKEKFLEYLEKANEHFSIIIHTYCLMNNHSPVSGDPGAEFRFIFRWGKRRTNNHYV